MFFSSMHRELASVREGFSSVFQGQTRLFSLYHADAPLPLFGPRFNNSTRRMLIRQWPFRHANSGMLNPSTRQCEQLVRILFQRSRFIENVWIPLRETSLTEKREGEGDPSFWQRNELVLCKLPLCTLRSSSLWFDAWIGKGLSHSRSDLPVCCWKIWIYSLQGQLASPIVYGW